MIKLIEMGITCNHNIIHYSIKFSIIELIIFIGILHSDGYILVNCKVLEDNSHQKWN